MPVQTNFRQTATAWRNLIALQLNAANLGQVSVAQQLAPVKTRALQRSIAVTEEASPENLRAVSEVGVHYGIYQEFGFVHWMNAMFVEPQPFWTPAFQLARHQLLNSLRTLGGRADVQISYGVTTLSNPETFVSR